VQGWEVGVESWLEDFFLCIWTFVPMSSECSHEALARGRVGVSSILRYFLSMAQRSRQKKKSKPLKTLFSLKQKAL